MARKRGGKPGSYSPILGLLVIAALAGGSWYVWHHHAGKASIAHDEPSSTPAENASVRIDPANEGKTVRVNGDVHMEKAAQDPQLGIHSDSPVLWRKVEMLQWVEHCAEGKCAYALDWSPAHVDSSGFHDKGGHENTGGLPFVSKTFLGEHVRLGPFVIDNANVPDESGASLYPIRVEQLRENLAATFHIEGGILFAATNAEHPESGDMRVTYRVLPPGQKQTWSGIQRGDRLQ